MNKIKHYALGVGFLVYVALISTAFKADQASVKCLVQLTNYTGEGAYVVVSLIDTKGKYVKTLQVLGREQRWYDEIPSWFAFKNTSKENLDGITGASIKAGGRKVFNVNIDEALMNKGYKLRFETSVEVQKYYEKDAEVDLKEENFSKNINGSGYIRYVKLIKNP